MLSLRDRSATKKNSDGSTRTQSVSSIRTPTSSFTTADCINRRLLRPTAVSLRLIACLDQRWIRADIVDGRSDVSYLTFSRRRFTRCMFTSASNSARQISPSASFNTSSLMIVALLRFRNADERRRPRSARTIEMYLEEIIHEYMLRFLFYRFVLLLIEHKTYVQKQICNIQARV